LSDIQRVGALLGSTISEGTREESNVVVLVAGNLRESSSNPVWVTGGGKVLGRELGKCVGAVYQLLITVLDSRAAH
jgi:hypothetical protein